MDHFEYLSVMISIILGLGVAHLIADATRLLQGRARVRLYWVTVVWGVVLFLLHIQVWWALFSWRLVPEWNYFSFLLMILPPLVLYAIAVLVLPEFDVREGVDLRVYYYQNQRWFFGLFTLLLLLFIAQPVLVRDMDPLHGSNIFRLGIAALFASCAFIRAPRFHAVVAPLILGLLVLFIALYSIQVR